MHKLRKAAVVAVIVGGMGLFGTGVASAHAFGGKGFGDFVISVPQFEDCSYIGNTNTALTQIATPVTGDAVNTALLGNVCVQTGPSF